MSFSNNRPSFETDNSIGTYVTTVCGIGMAQPLKSPDEPLGYREMFVFKQVGSGGVNTYTRFTVDGQGNLVTLSSSTDATPTALLTAFKTMPAYGLYNTITASEADDVLALLS